MGSCLQRPSKFRKECRLPFLFFGFLLISRCEIAINREAESNLFGHGSLQAHNRQGVPGLAND